MKINLYQPLAIHELGARQNQEDAIFPLLNQAKTDDRIFIVCDGMGGHEHGEVASNTVCEVLSKEISSHLANGAVLTDEMLNDALEKAWQQLDEKDSQSSKKMGTTLTLLCFHRGGCTLAHIGDSRIYHIRPADSKILYKSRDHSLVFDLFRAGEITLEEMKTHPQKNVITRAMMPGKQNRAKADITHVTDIQPDDYFYLCSDGMLEQMEDYELLSIFTGSGGDEKKRQQLIAATMENGDNHSAYLVRISNVEREPNDELLPDDEQSVAWNVADLQPEIEQAEVVNVASDADATPPPSKPQSPQPTTPKPVKNSATKTEKPVAVPRIEKASSKPSKPISKNKSRKSLFVSALLVLAMIFGGYYLYKSFSPMDEEKYEDNEREIIENKNQQDNSSSGNTTIEKENNDNSNIFNQEKVVYPCKKCNKRKELQYMSNEANVCKECFRTQKQENVYPCKICNKMKKSKFMSNEANVCKECASKGIDSVNIQKNHNQEGEGENPNDDKTEENTNNITSTP